MKILLLSVLVCFSLVACSNITETHYLETQNWSGLAHFDVESGKARRTNENLQQLGAVTATSHEEYISAYQAHEKIYCNPQNGYKLGILGKPRNAVCINNTPMGRLFEENWKVGLESGNNF